MDVNDPNLTRAKAAKQLADQMIAAKLKAERISALLRKRYSYGFRAGAAGWAVDAGGVGSLAAPYDVLETEAVKLEPEQVAEPIEAEDHIFILKLESKRAESYEPFEKVQHNVEMSIKLQRRKDAVDKLTAKLMEQADVGDKNMFLELCLQKAYQQVKQN